VKLGPLLASLALAAVIASGAAALPASLPTAATPAVYPVPQSIQPRAGVINVPPRVRLVGRASTDLPAVAVVRSALKSVGATLVAGVASPLTIYVGRNAAAEQSLRVPDASTLAPGGYVLAAGLANGRNVIVLDGADGAGQYYAAQTLRQLLAGHKSLQSVVVRDWPSFPVRGMVEGFYGKPWSVAERLSAIDFLGAHKLNFYMYGPKDDPYLRAQWATPFPAGYLTLIRNLVQRGTRDHVRINLIISPGLSICYSSPADQQLLIQKLDAAWDVGVRSFTVALDDIDLNRPPCPSDAAYGTGSAAAASAQASLLNAVDTGFIATHPGAAPLIAVPTEYNGVDPTPYTHALSAALPPDVTVQWTGRYGISVVISDSDARAAVGMWRHPLLGWDNYFVTDYATGFLALGPLDRHDATLPASLTGLVADPMVQPEASRIGLFTVADYTWNPAQYDPLRSWNASLNEFTGGNRQVTTALRTFADANWGSLLNPLHAPALAGAIDKFWSSWIAGDTSAAGRLDSQLKDLAAAPTTLRANLSNQAFLAEASPWLDATEAWAKAARTALQVLVARRGGKNSQADAIVKTLPALVERANSFAVLGTSVQVAPGVLDKFVADAQRTSF
jgi:hyaluronoglucosaminidase